jgi:hypothetical protein
MDGEAMIGAKENPNSARPTGRALAKAGRSNESWPWRTKPHGAKNPNVLRVDR